MKNYLLLALLFSFIPFIINGQTLEATTSDGKKVILNTDGTWKYADVATTSDGRKVILNADSTWRFAEINNELEENEAQRIRAEQEEIERQRIKAEQKRQADVMNRTKAAMAGSKNVGTSSISEGVAGRPGNQGSGIMPGVYPY